jgi:hypothetical protein
MLSRFSHMRFDWQWSQTCRGFILNDLHEHKQGFLASSACFANCYQLYAYLQSEGIALMFWYQVDN